MSGNVSELQGKKIKKEKDLVGWTLKAVFQIACLKR